MPTGNAFPVRSMVPNTVIAQGRWSGGGAAADCTLASVNWSEGILSIVYVSTGIYTVTFTEVGHQLIDYSLNVENLTGVNPVVGKVVAGSFSRTDKTVSIEFGDTLIDLLTTDRLLAKFVWVKNPRA